jgi:hypothetical protein
VRGFALAPGGHVTIDAFFHRAYVEGVGLAGRQPASLPTSDLVGIRHPVSGGRFMALVSTRPLDPWGSPGSGGFRS